MYTGRGYQVITLVQYFHRQNSCFECFVICLPRSQPHHYLNPLHPEPLKPLSTMNPLNPPKQLSPLNPKPFTPLHSERLNFSSSPKPCLNFRPWSTLLTLLSSLIPKRYILALRSPLSRWNMGYMGGLTLVYPEPYSIYLRGTLNPKP